MSGTTGGRPAGHPGVSPSQVVADVLRLLEAEDYDGAAALHHPDYARWVLEDASGSTRPERRLPTVEGLLRMYPDMPREAAEYDVRKARERPPPPPWNGGLFGVESDADLAALTAREALARRLKGTDHRWRYRAYLDELATRHPEYRDQLQVKRSQETYMWSGTPLGHVEADGRAYVVLGPPGAAPDRLPDDHAARLVVLRAFEGAWRVTSDVAPSSGMVVHFHVAVLDADGHQVVLS